MHERKNNSVPGEHIGNTNLCGYCRSARSVKLYPTSSITHDHFYLSRCLDCRTVFLTPRPSDEQLKLAYDDCYYGTGEQKFSGLFETIRNYFRFSRARRLMRYINPPGCVLDIGCGNGKFLDYLIKRGFDGYGIELPGKAAERASKIPQLHLKTGQISDEDFSDSFFDAVTLWHVFEHLTEPEETLRIISRILKPGGNLHILMPNIESLQSKIFKGNWLHVDPPKHLVFLVPKDLTAKLKKFDFELIKQKHFSLEQNPFGIQQSILNCLTRKRDVLFEALKGNRENIKGYSACNIMLQKLFCMGTFPIFAALAGFESLIKKGGTIEMIFRKK